MIEPARLAGGAVLRSQSDERLVDLARAGNDRAFEAIVHRYRRPLLRYCGRFLTGARAEDAVQQAFMNAYAAIKADDRQIELRPWLYRIAHNAALNALRAARGAAEEPIDEQIDGVERPDQAFERRERLADVVAAVQALPPRQRDAIVLHELEGRSYEQIAAEMRVSGGAVRQLLARARTTLRAGATAVVPDWLLVRLATSADGETVAARIGEAVAAGGGAAVLAKVGAAVVVAGAVAVGAREVPPSVTGGDRPAREAAAAEAPAGQTSAGGTVRPISASPGVAVAPASTRNGGATRPGSDAQRGGESGQGSGSGDSGNSGGDSGNSGGGSGNSGGNHDSADEHSADASDDDGSGSGSGSDDSSQSGSESHGDDPSGGDDPAPAVEDDGGSSPNSGPGSQPQSPPVDVPEIDDSGSGKSGSSAAPGNSGPGSSNTRPPDGDE